MAREAARAHTVTGSSGQPVTRYFCPACGSPLWSEPAAFAGRAFVKAGAFDEDPGLPVARAIWTDSAPEWHPAAPAEHARG